MTGDRRPPRRQRAYVGSRPRRSAPAGGVELLAVVLLALWLATLALGGILELARPSDGGGTVSWWGHLGGLVAGLILVSLYRQARREAPAPAPRAGRRRPTHHRPIGATMTGQARRGPERIDDG